MTRFAIAVLLCGTAVAQVSDGPFIGLPAHMLVDDNTTGAGGTLAEGDLYLKRAGFGHVALSGPSFGPNTPDFSFGAMFPSVPPAFHLGSFSSGFHTVYVDWSDPLHPLLTIPGGAWVFMFYSVTKDTNGEPGSLIETEANASEGPGGDMFSIVLPGSNVPANILDCVDVGVPNRANDSSELGLLSTTQPELRDFDPFFSFYENNDQWHLRLDPNPSVYFTLPTNVAYSVPSWFASGNPSGATILRIQWSTISGWSTLPSEFRTYQQLGLAQGHEIDALSVDELSHNICLSLKKTASTTDDHQLMVAHHDGVITHPAAPYFYDTTAFAGGGATRKVTRILGADEEGDVDAVCIGDPNRLQGQLTVYFPYIYGCRPAPPGANWLSTMSTSVWMSPGYAGPASTDPNYTLAISVSGLQNSPGAGLVAFLLWGEPVNAWDPFTSTYDVFGTVLGWNYALATTQTARIDLTIPHALAPLNLDFQWLMLDSSGIYQSNVVGCKF